MTQAQILRARFLGLVADGMTTVEACRTVERTLSWYEKSREAHPDWARQVTDARLKAKDPSLAGIDFVQFRKTYFGYDTAPHHYRIVEGFELTKPGQLTVVLGFPGLGKTQTLTDYYSYLLAEDPNNRICVISEGQQLSRNIIGQVSDRMTDEQRFPLYHARYGPFKQTAWDDKKREEEDRDPLKRAWTADYFKLLAADADQKDPSLASFGATSRIYGARFDYFVMDDIQSNETLVNTDKYLRSFRTSWSSRINLGQGQLGKMIAVGSRVGAGDIYEKLDDEGLIDNLITIPAMTAHVPRDEHFTIDAKGRIEVNPDCPAQPTWEGMTLEHLAVLRRKAGEENWARTYMQDIVTDTAAVFTPEMMEQAKDQHRIIGPAPVGVDRWCAIDPALDTGMCAYMAAAIDSRRFYILDSLSVTDTRTYTDIYDRIRQWKVKYHPSLWVVEQNNFQKGMLQDDRLHTAAHPANVLSHQTSGRTKNDNVMGVRMMANSFADGEIRIPWGDETTRNRMQPLVDELRRWRPNVKGAVLQMDRVMTLWFLWMRWQAEREYMDRAELLLPRPSWSGSDRNLHVVRSA